MNIEEFIKWRLDISRRCAEEKLFEWHALPVRLGVALPTGNVVLQDRAGKYVGEFKAEYRAAFRDWEDPQREIDRIDLTLKLVSGEIKPEIDIAHSELLAQYASIWSDHPAYRPEWAPKGPLL